MSQNKPTIAIKIDVDTEAGTRIGIPNFLKLFTDLKIPATFYLSLGPDNTGRAIKRVFRPGFLKKVSRTSVISTYGIRTLLNGVLLPGPHIGKRHATLLRSIKEQGFDVGIHAYDHQRWQDGVARMSQPEIADEFQKALQTFQTIFGDKCITAAAPGWQANAKTLAVYDKANLLYASDCRGRYPFFPKIENTVFHVLQIPTTLPTLDELIGRPEFPIEKLSAHYLSLLSSEYSNIITIHTELEGTKYLAWFKDFLITLKKHQIEFTSLANIAKNVLKSPQLIPICEFTQGTVEGRSGSMAIQKINNDVQT